MSTPFLSICIPTYNRVGYLKKCLKSVLAQVTDEVEVVVEDNCSTDGTEEWMKTMSDPHVRYIRNQENVGLVNNVIQIIANAKGKGTTYSRRNRNQITSNARRTRPVPKLTKSKRQGGR